MVRALDARAAIGDGCRQADTGEQVETDGTRRAELAHQGIGVDLHITNGAPGVDHVGDRRWDRSLVQGHRCVAERHDTYAIVAIAAVLGHHRR